MYFICKNKAPNTPFSFNEIFYIFTSSFSTRRKKFQISKISNHQIVFYCNPFIKHSQSIFQGQSIFPNSFTVEQVTKVNFT